MIEQLASLLALELDEAEGARLEAELGAIVAYVDQLAELALDHVPPARHPAGLAGPLRDDEPEATLERAAALALAPEHDGEHVLVPKVI